MFVALTLVKIRTMKSIKNITNESDTLQKFTFQVNGIDCSSCATTIEKALLPLDDVYNPKVNFYWQINSRSEYYRYD